MGQSPSKALHLAALPPDADKVPSALRRRVSLGAGYRTLLPWVQVIWQGFAEPKARKRQGRRRKAGSVEITISQPAQAECECAQCMEHGQIGLRVLAAIENACTVACTPCTIRQQNGAAAACAAGMKSSSRRGT